MIPTKEECRRLMGTYRMLDNIQRHSVVVARIAELIADDLSGNDFDIPLNLTVSAALLHDIGKTLCLHNGENHALKGRDICLEHGFGEVAVIVEEHVILKSTFPAQPISAKEIVYYADKRVNHDQIVNLDDRLEYILSQYGRDSATMRTAIRKNFQSCLTIEKEIFSHLDYDPDQLKEKVLSKNGEIYNFFADLL